MEEKSDKLTFQNQNRHVVSSVACPPGILPTTSPLRSCHVVSLGVRTSSSLLQIAGVRTVLTYPGILLPLPLFGSSHLIGD